MGRLVLRIIDTEKLMKKLNSEIIPVEGRLSLGQTTRVEPKKSSFFNRFLGKEIEVRRHYPLIQTAEYVGIFSFFYEFLGSNTESDKEIGHLFLEEGFFDYEGRFADLELRIRHPLELEDDDIPYCNIKISVETREWGAPKIDRIDHIKKARLYWQKTDLSRLLPTEWFLRD